MKDSDKIILDLCGGSGAWSEPYVTAGYDVRLLDITNGCDVRLLKKQEESIYGILSAPPCTHLSLAGARFWAEKGDKALLEALSVIDACLRIIHVNPPIFWVLENPTGRLIHYLGKPKMKFNPCDYGDPYSKKTYLWGNFNPPGKWFPTQPIIPPPGHHSMDVYLKISSHKIRSTTRSITPPGFAKAFFEANK